MAKPFFAQCPKINGWAQAATNVKQMGHEKIFPGGSDGDECACTAGDTGSVSGWGRSPGEGNGSPLQDSCLEISMDRGAWLATVHGVAKSQT